jgi:hypothetical protein
MTPISTKFQNALADIDETCTSIREEVAKYSDGEELVDADVTAALAWLNALRSIETLIRGANAQ